MGQGLKGDGKGKRPIPSKRSFTKYFKVATMLTRSTVPY